MRTWRIVAAVLALGLAGLAHAQMVPIYCNTTTQAACSPTTNPGNGSQGEAGWQGFGKANTWAAQLGLFALNPAGEFLATPATTTGIPGLRSIVVTDLPITVPELNIAGTWTAPQTFNSGVTASALTLSGITGTIQCLEASSAGVVTGTGAACGSGSGGPVTLPSAAALGDIWYGSAADVMSALGGYVATPGSGVLTSTPTTLTAPTNGALTATSGGTLAATTDYVESTWVNANGETVGSTETSLAVAADNVLNVAAPASPPASATGWNVYVSSSTGTETKQNSTPIAVGTAWVEPTSGLIAGSALPTANTATVAAAPAWHATSSLSSLTADTSPASGDLLLIHSLTGASDESITIGNLLSGMLVPISSSTTTTAGDCYLSTATAGVYAPGACPAGSGGSGVTVESGGASQGTATTLNFSTGLSASVANGVATITATGSAAAQQSLGFMAPSVAPNSGLVVGPGAGQAAGSSSDSGVIVTFSGTLKNLYVHVQTLPAANDYTFTVYYGAAGSMVATALTCTITSTSANNSCSDTADTVPIAAAAAGAAPNEWALRIATQATTNSTGVVSVGLELN